MKISIHGFWKCQRAEFKFNNITLIGGKNFNGKSSIATATRLLLTGEKMPPKMAQTEAAKIVNDTGTVALLKLESESGMRTVEYPKIKVTGTNANSWASKVATGYESPVDMTDKDRASFYSDLLKTEATEDDLRQAIKEANLSDEGFQKLWKTVKTTGWDGALKDAKDKGIEYKGQWKQITGEVYGEVKAQGWRPTGLFPPACPPEEIEAILAERRKERDIALKQTAIDENETLRLKDYADKYEFALETAQGFEADKKALVDELNALKKPEILTRGLECPECKTALKIVSGMIVKGEAVTPEQEAKSKRDITDYEMKASTLRGKIEAANKSLFEAEHYLQQCQEAKSKLEKIENAPKLEAYRPVSEIDDLIKQHETDLKTVRDIAEAAKLHSKIQTNQIIVDVLSPEGVRKTVLINGIERFNAILARISAWGDIRLTPDLNMTRNGYPYALCSSSEQWRIRTTLQIAVAELDGSCAVVIDDADILDAQGKNHLINMLVSANKIGIIALVCMTFSDRAKMPDLSKLDGYNYWTEEGILK